LSRTQVAVLSLLAARRSNARIAETLGLAPSTVKWNVSQVLGALGVTRREEAADWWRARHGVRPVEWRDCWEEEGARMSTGPVISNGTGEFAAKGGSLEIQEWAGSAPGELHVHHAGDIAWHVLEGSLRFRFADGEKDIAAGQTLFVPAGTAHTYGEGEDSRYLVIAPPRLFELFQALRTARSGRPYTEWGKPPDAEIYRKYESELLEAR
jgi:quercetin dioxygenase-like cupin family protein/DNA-binding CsgD family transcriptional regulator